MRVRHAGQVEGYSDVYDGNSMLFMDFRRHHSGVWAGTAPRCSPPGRTRSVRGVNGVCIELMPVCHRIARTLCHSLAQ